MSFDIEFFFFFFDNRILKFHSLSSKLCQKILLQTFENLNQNFRFGRQSFWLLWLIMIFHGVCSQCIFFFSLEKIVSSHRKYDSAFHLTCAFLVDPLDATACSWSPWSGATCGSRPANVSQSLPPFFKTALCCNFLLPSSTGI